MQTVKVGIKETRELLKLGLCLMVTGSLFLQKKTAEGSASLMESVASAFPALEGISQVDDELRELDASEIDLLTEDVKAQLPHLVPEQARMIANIALVVASSIAKGVIALQETKTAS